MEEDIDIITLMGRHFYNYSAFKDYGLNFDFDSFRDFVRNVYDMTLKDTAVILVAVDNPTASVVGSIGGILVPWMLDQSQVIMAELWWWMEPDHRGGTGIKLVKTLEKEAQELGAQFMSMVTLGNRREDTLQQLYERMGYRHLEQYHLKGLRP